MRAALYARVSTAAGQDPAMQLRELREYCDRRHWQIGGEFDALGIQFVSLHEGVDTSTPNGRLVFGLFASIAEFERELIRDRVRSGIAAARARGTRLGRPRRDVDGDQVAALRAEGLSWREIGRTLGVGVATARAAFQARAKNLSELAPVSD
jgi:DNA invertase Pin-like site-specific DNA recombinase